MAGADDSDGFAEFVTAALPGLLRFDHVLTGDASAAEDPVPGPPGGRPPGGPASAARPPSRSVAGAGAAMFAAVAAGRPKAMAVRAVRT